MVRKMKIRKDFVTNSSSSSFIVSRDDITHGHLLDILLEMANLDASKWYEDDEDGNYYSWDDVCGGGVGRYNIIEYVDEPYIVYSWIKGVKDKVYNNVFVVDNDSNCKYDWDMVEEVLKRHGLECVRGYCD